MQHSPDTLVTATMSSRGADSFANRDTPSHHFSATRLKDRLESLGDNMNRESGNRMGDNMFNLYVGCIHFTYPFFHL